MVAYVYPVCAYRKLRSTSLKPSECERQRESEFRERKPPETERRLRRGGSPGRESELGSRDAARGRGGRGGAASRATASGGKYGTVTVRRDYFTETAAAVNTFLNCKI